MIDDGDLSEFQYKATARRHVDGERLIVSTALEVKFVVLSVVIGIDAVAELRHEV
jgi:hypothetical protein